MTKTTLATQEDHAKAMSCWYVVDASKHVLGRMSAAIATVLMGKHKPLYTQHVSVGECVVVIHAEKLVVTGNKLEKDIHTHWSGYPGGLKERTLGSLVQRNPEQVIRDSVRRMLPKNRLGRDMLRRLKVYVGGDHPHAAQRPTELPLKIS